MRIFYAIALFAALGVNAVDPNPAPPRRRREPG